MPQDDDRHTLDDTKRLLCDGVWSMEKHPSRPFTGCPGAQLLLLWLIEHISQHDRAPLDHTRWDKLKWHPRVKIPGSARISPARRIGDLRRTTRQTQESHLRKLHDIGLIDFGNGFQNIRIMIRDADDLDAYIANQEPATATARPSVPRTVLMRGLPQAVAYDPELRQSIN